MTKRDAPRLPLDVPEHDRSSTASDSFRAERVTRSAHETVLRAGIIALLFCTPLIFPWRIQHGEALTYRFSSFLIPKEAVTKIAVPVMACYWFIAMIREGTLRFRSNRVLLPLTVLATLGGVSVLYSPTPYSSTVEFTNLLVALMFFFIAVNVFSNEQQLRQGLNAVFFSAVTVSALSLVQLCGGLAGLFPRYPGNPQRMYSTFGNDSGVAGYLLPVLPIGIGLLLASARKLVKWFYFGGLAAIGYAIIACQTRGVWLGILVSLPFLLVAMLTRRELRAVLNEHKIHIVLGLALVAVFIIVQSLIPGTTTGDTDTLTRAKSSFVLAQPGVNLRAVFWGAGMLMVADRPVFGFGLGSYKYYAQQYQGKLMAALGPTSWLQPNELDIETAHNDYVQLASELGVLGVGVLVSGLVILYRSVRRTLDLSLGRDVRCIKLSACSGLVGMAVFAATNFPFHIVTHALVFMFLLLVVTGVGDLSSITFGLKRLPKYSIAKLVLSSLVIGCGVLFLVFVTRPYAADYHAASASLMELVEPRSDAVLDELQKAVRWEPHNGLIRANLGRIYLQHGMIGHARAELTRALKEYDSAWVHINLGSACEAQGKFDEAALHYSDAAFRAPRYALPRKLLAQALIKGGRYDEAERRLEEAARWVGDMKNVLETQDLQGTDLFKGRERAVPATAPESQGNFAGNSSEP